PLRSRRRGPVGGGGGHAPRPRRRVRLRGGRRPGGGAPGPPPPRRPPRRSRRLAPPAGDPRRVGPPDRVRGGDRARLRKCMAASRRRWAERAAAAAARGMKADAPTVGLGRTWSRWLSIAGAGAILALTIFIALAPALLRPGTNRLPIIRTPGDYGVAFETVEFRPPDEAITLRAWWMPVAQPKAAIILVHGGGDDNRSLPYAGGLELARDLVERGYAILAVDLRNYGESDPAPEGVTFGDAESNDVIGAMNYLAQRAPALRYGAIGFSMGGEAVLYAAAR